MSGVKEIGREGSEVQTSPGVVAVQPSYYYRTGRIALHGLGAQASKEGEMGLNPQGISAQTGVRGWEQHPQTTRQTPTASEPRQENTNQGLHLKQIS